MRRIRYSITTILFLTAIAALALTFRPAWLNPPTVEQKIFGILNDDVADREKMEKISAYVSVGEDTNKIESQLGPCWNFNTNEDGRFRHKLVGSRFQNRLTSTDTRALDWNLI